MILFKKITHLLKETNQLQDNIDQAFKKINDSPFIGGKFIKVERSDSNQFDINTGLGRSVKGWIVTDTNVSATFYRVKTNRDSTGILTIKPSASGNFTFWIF
jgi:hypothetical protein